eukprot:TRINITY_DN30757_c0_g2_i1.p1 TRINITY_DN30757_c0_g2~~TRINITY_DN30757_c0_g2_i1.p1  ORF type:complete len:159 (-),score=34.42 TRINITY_DN30757_c0_g2_i1:13-489(-)
MEVRAPHLATVDALFYLTELRRVCIGQFPDDVLKVISAYAAGFSVGACADVFDKNYEVWCVATILGINNELRTAKVHFIGWNSSCNETVLLDDQDWVAEAFTKTKPSHVPIESPELELELASCDMAGLEQKDLMDLGYSAQQIHYFLDKHSSSDRCRT